MKRIYAKSHNPYKVTALLGTYEPTLRFNWGYLLTTPVRRRSWSCELKYRETYTHIHSNSLPDYPRQLTSK